MPLGRQGCSPCSPGALTRRDGSAMIAAMKTRTSLLLLCFFTSSGVAQSDIQKRVDELFGEGVFGVKWGDSFDTVKLAHPGGKTDTSNAVVTLYTVEDGRTVLQLERRRRDDIAFTFQGGQLRGISVEFPDCADVTSKLWEVLGSITEKNEQPPSGW